MVLRFVPAGTEVANVVVGALAIALGIASIVYRRHIVELTARFQRQAWGDRMSRGAERWQSPFWIGFAGVLALCMGTVMVTLGALTLILAR